MKYTNFLLAMNHAKEINFISVALMGFSSKILSEAHRAHVHQDWLIYKLCSENRDGSILAPKG